MSLPISGVADFEGLAVFEALASYQESLLEKKLALSVARSGNVRRVLVLVHPDSRRDLNPEAMKAIDHFYNHREGLLDDIDEIITRLERGNGDRAFPRVDIRFARYPASSGSLDAFLTQAGTRAGEYRLVATILPDGAFTLGGDILEFGISHLVIASFPQNGKYGWRPSAGFGDAHVNLPFAKLPCLFIDIMLDVTMHLALPEVDTIFGADLPGRRRLAMAKAAYADLRGLNSSFYGPPTPEGMNYVCFASLVRHLGTFGEEECKQYMALWHDFIRHSAESVVLRAENNGSGGISHALTSSTASALARTIRGSHHRGGQISQRRLRFALARLSPGGYYFVLAERKPPRRQDRRAIVLLMGKKKWHANMWAIVPKKDYSSLIRRYHFLSFLPFNITE